MSAREKRNPSGHPQEIVVNTFTAFTGTRGQFLEDFFLAQQKELVLVCHTVSHGNRIASESSF